jgi:two-component system cell cycle sensor histidine kinase/response regulator CckA
MEVFAIRFDKFSLKTILITISLVLLFTMIIIIGYYNYAQHKNTVIRQQQEHLLTIAKGISRNIDTFIKDKADSSWVLAQNPIITKVLEMNKDEVHSNEYKDVLRTFYEKYNDEMESVLLLDENGTLIYQYPSGNSAKRKSVDAYDVNSVLKSKRTFVSKEYESSANEFSIDILEPVLKNNEVSGVLISSINLNKVYNKLIHPIRAGKKGYAMVKNMQGIIVMHPVVDQIGIESIRVRKEKFPEYNWGELEKLNLRQIEEGEGYDVYHSKWWQDNGRKWTKKINAYTTIKTSNISWIISVQMDYAEIEKPIRGTLINISLIALIITALLLIVVYIILKIDKKRKSLEIEAKYLKELNKTWKELIRSEERLRHSQKLQTIGTLTSGIAHEFNNLLTPILGYSEILLQTNDNKSAMYEDVLEIHKSALRAKEIIEQILVFSRNDNVVVKVKQLRVDFVVAESVKLIKSILPKNIKMVENIKTKELILGSATQLQQVLLNLYTNSYHAMKNNGGVLMLNVESIYISDEECNEISLPKGRYVKIQVKDNGSGMNKDTLNQIFDPFFTTKEVGEGTGLGLSVVHGIIKSHNGSIIVNSKIEVGTTMDIYLPIVEEVIEDLEKEQTLLDGTCNILVIDDNISVLKMVKKGLNSFGYNVITEKDGYEAMRIFDKDLTAFNVIILDYTMPSISGLEIARYLKMKNPSVKIILVSGYIKEDIALSYPNLFDDYLLKPILIPELVNKIKLL